MQQRFHSGESREITVVEDKGLESACVFNEFSDSSHCGDINFVSRQVEFFKISEVFETSEEIDINTTVLENNVRRDRGLGIKKALKTQGCCTQLELKEKERSPVRSSPFLLVENFLF